VDRAGLGPERPPGDQAREHVRLGAGEGGRVAARAPRHGPRRQRGARLGLGGGVVRLTPLEALTYVIPEDFTMWGPQGEVGWKDRPFDVGVSFGGGYTIIGEDFAYQGSYFQWGFDTKFFVTPNFAIGVDIPIRTPTYVPLRYTNFGDGDGLCTQGGKSFGRSGIEYPASPTRFLGDEFNGRDLSGCDGTPPAATFITPSLTIAGVFDFGSARLGSHEIERPGAPALQFDQCANVDGIRFGKPLRREATEQQHRGLDLGGLPGLAAREIRRLQSAGIVLVLGLALLVGRLGAGRAGRLEIQREVCGQFFNDALEEDRLVHGVRAEGLGISPPWERNSIAGHRSR
jgi:hypothetical protein